MFGFQRVGDLAWAAGDSRARGFLIGGTAGRTTLAGEGLQHQDGHSHLLASTIPNCRAYDPTFAYELAVIVHHALDAMYVQQLDWFYYITVMNENYAQPPMPADCQQGIVNGMYLLHKDTPQKTHVQLLGSGAILREVIQAAKLLREDFDVSADVWSVTSFNRLRREGMEVQRWNMLHPESPPKIAYVEQCLRDSQGPVIAASDYIKIYADQIRPYVKSRYIVLGTDGFGRSDTRQQLRSFFEVDSRHIALAALHALAAEGTIDTSLANTAITKYDIDPDKPDPVHS